MQFEFTTASKIIFGTGKLNSIGDLAQKMGNHALIMSGAPASISSRLMESLDEHGVKSSLFSVLAEPTIELIRHTVTLARQSSTNLFIGIGGGSAIDTAKATAALKSNPGDVMDYLEIVGANKPLTTPPLPLIAIPTTAGTGAEVTKNAVIESTSEHIKVSLRSPYLLPKLALIDPESTISLPSFITAFTGLDALTQLIEPFTCITPTPFVDAFCKDGIVRVARSLSKAFSEGKDIAAREVMSLASLFSGLALTNAKLGAVHGLAGPIGGAIPAHHGAICARLLPEVIETNIKAMHDRSPANPALERYTMIGMLLTGEPSSTTEDTINWVRVLCNSLKIQALSSYGLEERHFDAIIEKAMKSSSMKGNPIILSADELRNILVRCLQPL